MMYTRLCRCGSPCNIKYTHTECSNPGCRHYVKYFEEPLKPTIDDLYLCGNELIVIPEEKIQKWL